MVRPTPQSRGAIARDSHLSNGRTGLAVRVFIPSTAPVAAIAPYVQGANSTWSDGYTTSFTKGAWQTVVFTVPSSVTQPLNRVGVKLFLGGSFNGKVYLDAVGW
jgi:hypothetical protein